MITYGRNSVGTFPITFKGVFQDVIANKRWFRTNSGTTDYVQLTSPVVLSGDFEVEWTGQIPTQGVYVFCNSTHSNNRIAWTSAAGSVGFLLTINNAEVHNAIIPAVAAMRGDGKLHRFVLSRTGTALTLTVDGVGYPVGASAASFVIDRLMSKWNADTIIPNYTGILSDIRIKSADTLIHHWPMAEGSGSTHVDVIGGNHGTIINGQPSDWELFERLPSANEWVGRELVTDAVWDAPFQVGSQWSKVGDKWQYAGDGQFNQIVFFPINQLPPAAVVKWRVDPYSGSGYMRISTDPLVSGDRLFSSAGVKQVKYKSPINNFAFVRNSAGDVIACSISDLSIRRILEVVHA